MSIRVSITMTGKSYSPKDEYRCFGDDEFLAHDVDDAKVKLANRYGSSWQHRKPIFQDRKDGSTIQCGWVVGYRNADLSHYPVDKWLQQDWVSLDEITPVDVGDDELTK